MIRPHLTTFVLCAAAASFAVAQETPATRPAALAPPTPTTTPAQTLAELEATAINAFESGDYATALPLLKDLAVRQRNFPEKVGPLLEKVRVCEANLAESAPKIEGINAPRIPHEKPAAGAVLELGLQKLGNFNYDAEKGGNIPADVTALGGATIRVHGYMIPIDQSDQITKFVLVPDLFACCFGQPPSLQHTVIVSTPPGKAVGYFADQITVTGTLKVQEQREDGFITSIFELAATSIRPTP